MKVKYTLAEAQALGHLLLLKYCIHDNMDELEVAIYSSFKRYLARKYALAVTAEHAENVTLVIGRIECIVLLKYLSMCEPQEPMERVVHADIVQRMHKYI
jgi:hypothetical protein